MQVIPSTVVAVGLSDETSGLVHVEHQGQGHLVCYNDDVPIAATKVCNVAGFR